MGPQNLTNFTWSQSHNSIPLCQNNPVFNLAHGPTSHHGGKWVYDLSWTDFGRFASTLSALAVLCWLLLDWGSEWVTRSKRKRCHSSIEAKIEHLLKIRRLLSIKQPDPIVFGRNRRRHSAIWWKVHQVYFLLLTQLHQCLKWVGDFSSCTVCLANTLSPKSFSVQSLIISRLRGAPYILLCLFSYRVYRQMGDANSFKTHQTIFFFQLNPIFNYLMHGCHYSGQLIKNHFLVNER